MMQIFPSKMKKVHYKNGKLKEYNVSLGVKSQINDDRFHENENGKMVCDVLICFPDEYEKIHHENEESQSQIPSLNKTISKQKELIESMRNQLSSIDGEHEKALSDLKKEYSDKIEKLNEDLHEKDLEIERTKSELIEKYEREIGDLKEKIQKDLNDLELFDIDKHMLIKDHEEAVSKLIIYDEEYHMKKSDHEKELNRMRGNCLKLRVRENKKYSSYIEELDNFGRLEKFRNKDKAVIKEMRTFNKSTIDDKAIDVNFNLIDKAE